jgi:Peptidase M60, enhancin and enhancin-like/N-terminal domain of M60-like peptidases
MKKITLLGLSIGLGFAVHAQNTTTKDPSTIVIGPLQTLSKGDTVFRKDISNWSEKTLKSKDYATIKAHPSAAIFPGKVKDGYQFVNRKINIEHQKISESLVPIVSKLDYSGKWNDNLYSTGLYALPGEYIEIDVPKSIDTKGLKVQIGSHSDKLNWWVAGNEDWRRMPIIVKNQELGTGKVRLASPFGGLIYIAYPPRGESWKGEITIKHAIEAPFFQLGKTTLEQWQQQLASNKAPWGEITTPNVVITLPDSVLQKIKDLVYTMKLWDLIITGEMDLAQIPMPFYRAQRFVIDEHIGGGFMHSGYPMMVHHSPSRRLLSADVIANPDLLMKPSKGGANWGFFHEIGHNMQNMDWVFGGTTEVSNNLFSMYMFDRLLGGREDAHSGISNENTQKAMKKYFAEGPSYEKWKKDPFLGLISFRQLQEAFGWETFKTFFREYHQLPFEGRRVNDQEKIDFFVKTFSAKANRNIAPFFKTWGIPVSDKVNSELEKYQTWMPFNFPPKN